MAYDQKGDFDRAIADLNEAIRLVPKYVIFYGNRGDVYRHKGDPDRAVADYSEVLRLIPEGASSQYSDRGMACNDMGDDDRAIADFSETIRRTPTTKPHIAAVDLPMPGATIPIVRS